MRARLARSCAVLLSAVVLGAVWLAAAHAAPPHHAAQVELPAAGWLLTPYVQASSGELVLHLQPREGNAAEHLIDARSGAPWAGTPAQLMSRFTRLGLEAARDVQQGTGWDQQLLARLGCAPPVAHCSSPADAHVVLLVQPLAGRRLAWQLVDLRPLMRTMDELMAGGLDLGAAKLDAEDWALLQLTSRSATHRQRWLESLRSIASAERWQRLAAAARGGPRLLSWPALSGEGDTLDLAGELERQALTLHVARLAHALAGASANDAQRAERLGTLADALLLGSQSGFRVDLPSALVDVLLQLGESERARLADALAAEAARRQSHGLWCYARWMMAAACGAQAPWAAATPAGAAQASTAPALPSAAPLAPTPASTSASTSRPPSRPVVPPASARPNVSPAPAAGASAGFATPAAPAAAPVNEAPQEWALIQRQPQPITLLSYDETSGHLVPEGGAAAGLSFVARALGALEQGRFELQIAPNSRAPLRLAHGAYRVKVRLVLDYAREDRCRAGLLCLFGGGDRHARTERRDVVFELDAGNRFVARRRADFGHLLPLAAEGGQRYASTLTQARLAIEAVRFELR